MSDELDKARKDLEKTYANVRKDLGEVFVAFETLRNAGPTDDIYKALEDLQDVVKEVKTGGLIGSGAKKHRKAREKWIELGGS